MSAVAPASARFFLLDAVAGWRGTPTGLAERADDRALVIDPVPGVAQPLVASGADVCPPSDPLRNPAMIAADACAGVIVYDADDCSVVRIDTRTGGTARLPGVGGCGDALRQCMNPRALALLADGSFAIAEPGERRVQVFTADPHLLSNVFRFEPASKPVALAAARAGGLYVLDAGAGELVEYSLVNGRERRRIGGGALKNATAIATVRNHVAVLAGSRLAIFDATDDAVAWLDLPSGYGYSALAADDAGSVYTGALARGGWDGGTLRIDLMPLPRVVGFGPLGINGRIVSLAWTPEARC